jgi:alkylated DNA repair dioxygenase AlkB
MLAHMTTLPLKQEHIVLFGRPVAQPRLSLWMGDREATYRYSGRTFVPEPWDPEVAHLRGRIVASLGIAFNSVLLNLYRDGRDSMGFHSDDEPELGRDPIIASLSLGATRRFLLRPRQKKGTVRPVELALTHGSLLVMREGTQRSWVHGIAKERDVTTPRCNLTFRRVLSPHASS